MSFRTRLILAYTILWVLILALTLTIAVYSINFGLYGQVERTLLRYVNEVAQLYASGRAGEISLPRSGPVNVSFYSSGGQLLIAPTPDFEQKVPKNFIRAASSTAKPYYAPNFMAAYQEIPGAVVAVSQDTRYIESISTTVRNTLIQGMAFLLPLGALLIVLAARLSLIPLHRAASEVDKRGPRNLEPIVYTGPKDDLGVMVERVNELLAELQEARDRERAFLAEVSHELRTPLTSLNGYLERLSRNPGDTEMLERSRKIATHTARMVQDLLALARGEAERSVNAHIINLGDLLRQAVGEYPGVILKMPPEFPEVLGDPDRLLQLARNLIANAIRAAGTPEKVQVRVWMVKEPTDNPPDPYESADEARVTSTPEMKPPKQPWAAFAIVDRGPGITPEILPRLFTRFARGPEGGTGLGLAIAKQIAEAHGGEIRVASRPGETRFTVFLPLLMDEE
ncbi:HAMP domain-containing sensor histidine kinase [uncultured Meiothermus sp.]|jgi:signal transduction histidine kinase|uniref:sensor histidine kinase n=1 Tax=uncultured Meiothermus sp. TaxID=157471 RepID=UPI002627F3BC|nr:HAMP domain-containing sensor histidine kinase [uncultured Meiothermus sp.]